MQQIVGGPLVDSHWQSAFDVITSALAQELKAKPLEEWPLHAGAELP